MVFKELLIKMKDDGVKIKLPSWDGYWFWCTKDKSIKMHTRDNFIMDIRETKDVYYTVDNICSDLWIIANENNTPILSGVATFDFLKASEYLDRGLPMRRQCWFSSTNISSKAPRASIILKCLDESVDVWKPTIDDFRATDWTFFKK